MNSIEVRRVTTRREMDDFVRLPMRLHGQCPQYVPDLESDIRDSFRPERNAGLAFCEVQPFVAYRMGESAADGADGRSRRPEAVGRIVGIVNHRANRRWQQRCVRFSLIEFCDDAEVSAALLSAVEAWGREDTIQGPLGITDFDKEGMLVEDFELTGAMTSIWNPDYYPRHLEALGYQKAVDWLQVRIQIPSVLPVRYQRVATLAREMFRLKVRTMSIADVRGDYGRRAFQLLNQCYAHLFGFTEFTIGQMENFMRRYLLLIDRRLIPVVENEQGEIVGIAVTMVSLAEALQRSRGRLLPWGWWHLLWALKWHSLPSALRAAPLWQGGKADHVEMLLVAVRPDYQGLGVNALFFEYLVPIYNMYGIRWAETGPQLEDNLRVLSQWKPLKPQMVKRRRCYEKKLKD